MQRKIQGKVVAFQFFKLDSRSHNKHSEKEEYPTKDQHSEKEEYSAKDHLRKM